MYRSQQRVLQVTGNLKVTGTKVAIIGTVGVPACYGGFETLAENLIGENTFDFTVYCSGKEYEEWPRTYKAAALKYLPLRANGVQSIPYDILSLFSAIRARQDVVLVLGVSGAIVIPIARLFSKVRIVTNIDGLEWRRAKWNKMIRWYLRLSEKIAVKWSHTVIADNQAIAEYVRGRYGVEAEVIAYGGDHALVQSPIPSQALAHKPAHDYALALCRIEPENNVATILEAFAQSGAPLVFIGNWDRCDYGRQLKQKYGKHQNITIVDPVYDNNQLYSWRAGCQYYVHGHSAGGTNPSLVEIMHFGKGIVAFDCSYNRATTEGKALYFSDSEELAKLTQLDPVDHSVTGTIMREIARRRYTWSVVRQQYYECFTTD